MKARIFNIMQYEQHPETGEVLLTEETIKSALLSHRTIKRWAYICHDKDVYSALDEEHDPTHVQGTTKPRHWHICIETGTNQIEVGVIAKWFKIADNFVNVAKGRGAFLDIVRYLTHEDDKQQALGKRLYPDEEVKASVGFDFRTELDKRAENKLKYGADLDPGEQMCFDVLYNGKTLADCVNEDRMLYKDNMDKLKKFRLDYLARQNPPAFRINYYVQGKGGAGKGLMSRAIARSLFPMIENDDQIFFEVGAKDSAFEGYDGQPVIIWNDRRHVDLLKELKGRGNVFNVFDTHPTRQKQNIKYSSISLVNSVNIVNSVEPYTEFLEGLCASYKDEEAEDKGQSYRRFPFIIPLRADDFDIMLNRGFMEDDGNFFDYIEHKNIMGNMQRIHQLCRGNEELARLYEAQTVRPIAQLHGEVVDKFTPQPLTEKDIADIATQLQGYGAPAAKPAEQPPEHFELFEKDGKQYAKITNPYNGHTITLEVVGVADEVEVDEAEVPDIDFALERELSEQFPDYMASGWQYELNDEGQFELK